MAPRPPQRSQFGNVQPVWCLDLTYGGRVYRVATQPVDIDQTDGSVLHYADGLSEPAVIDETSREGINTSGSIPLTVILDGVVIAEQVARGHRLEAARGHLFMVLADITTGRANQSAETVFPVLTGRLSNFAYAGHDRVDGWLAFKLEDDPGDDTSLLLDSDAVINDETWSSAPSTSAGKIYPVVIGTPGVFRKSSGEASTTSGSPAYVVEVTGADADTLLIAGHAVLADTVTVFDADGASESFNVTGTVDGLGRLVATLDVSGASSIDLTLREFWVCWNGGAGLASPFGAGALSGLGDVCAWALLRTSLPVDIEAWIAESGVLNRVEISTYINESKLTPWSYVARLLDGLFVEVRPGPMGLYPHGRVLDLAMAEGLATLIEGPELEPAGPMISRGQLSDVINQVTIRFAPRARTGDFKRRVIVGPEADASNPEAFTDEYAVMSVNRWSTDPANPVIQAESIDLPHIYDESSAALIARERVRLLGLGYETRAYLADPRLGWVMAGDQLRLESESLYRTMLATVASKEWTGSAWALVFEFDNDPIRVSSLKKSGA